MPIQALPREIVVIILKLLPSKKDLSSISLVSTYFLHLVRPELFASIHLPRNPQAHVLRKPYTNAGRYPRDYKDFLSFLTSAPNHALLIRHLTLWEKPLGGNFRDLLPLGPLDLDLLHSMISSLPSLQSIWLHGVTFKRSNVALPYKPKGIGRLIISRTPLWGFIIPMELFSPIDELIFLSCAIGKEFWDFGASFEQTLASHGVSNVFSGNLQAFSIHISSYFWDIEDWIEMLRKTSTSKILRSFSVHCNLFTADCHATSTMFDFLQEAAPTLAHVTFGASHIKKGSFAEDFDDDQYAYRHFDSDEMRRRLAPLTSLCSVTLKFEFHSTGFNPGLYPRADVFAHMILLLASFPPCLRRITLSFANPTYDLKLSPGVAYATPHGGSWLWPELNLRPLIPLLQRYEQLEAVVFEGAEGTTAEERKRILNDLPELTSVIRFDE